MATPLAEIGTGVYKSHCDDRLLERVNLFTCSKEGCCSTPFGVVYLWLIIGFLPIYYPAGIKKKSMFFRFLITHFAYAKRSFRNDKDFL